MVNDAALGFSSNYSTGGRMRPAKSRQQGRRENSFTFSVGLEAFDAERGRA